MAETSSLFVTSVSPWPSGLTNDATASDSPSKSCRDNRAVGILAADSWAPGSQSVAEDVGRETTHVPSLISCRTLTLPGPQGLTLWQKTRFHAPG